MLSGNCPASQNAAFENACAHGHGTISLARNIGIEQYQRMEIPICRMEDIGHAQALFLRYPVNLHQYLSQLMAWNGAIHTQIVRGEAAHRRES